MKKNPKTKTHISYTWRELRGEELLSHWKWTHMGVECKPPKRMFHAPIHKFMEMWIFEEKSGSFHYFPRLKFSDKDWWSARQPGLKEQDSLPKTFDEAKKNCLKLLNDELKHVRRRFESKPWPDYFDRVFQEDLELTEEEK